MRTNHLAQRPRDLPCDPSPNRGQSPPGHASPGKLSPRYSCLLLSHSSPMPPKPAASPTRFRTTQRTRTGTRYQGASRRTAKPDSSTHQISRRGQSQSTPPHSDPPIRVQTQRHSESSRRPGESRSPDSAVHYCSKSTSNPASVSTTTNSSGKEPQLFPNLSNYSGMGKLGPIMEYVQSGHGRNQPLAPRQRPRAVECRSRWDRRLRLDRPRTRSQTPGKAR